METLENNRTSEESSHLKSKFKLYENDNFIIRGKILCMKNWTKKKNIWFDFSFIRIKNTISKSKKFRKNSARLPL